MTPSLQFPNFPIAGPAGSQSEGPETGHLGRGLSLPKKKKTYTLSAPAEFYLNGSYLLVQQSLGSLKSSSKQINDLGGQR